MSCGGSAKWNRNAQAIQEAVKDHRGVVTTAQAREMFHRLTDEARDDEAARFQAAHGRSPNRAEARDITQAAHATARARLAQRVDAYATNMNGVNDLDDTPDTWKHIAEVTERVRAAGPAPQNLTPEEQTQAFLDGVAKWQQISEEIYGPSRIERPDAPRTPLSAEALAEVTAEQQRFAEGMEIVERLRAENPGPTDPEERKRATLDAFVKMQQMPRDVYGASKWPTASDEGRDASA